MKREPRFLQLPSIWALARWAPSIVLLEKKPAPRLPSGAAWRLLGPRLPQHKGLRRLIRPPRSPPNSSSGWPRGVIGLPPGSSAHASQLARASFSIVLSPADRFLPWSSVRRNGGLGLADSFCGLIDF